MTTTIIEKKLGIPGNYQYNALTKGLWPQRYWHQNKFDVLRKIIPADITKVVLDLGTGSGNFELLFAGDFKKIVGLDYNDEALGFLKKTLSVREINNVELVLADIRKIPVKIKKSKFDFIVIVDTIEHIRTSEVIKLVRLVRTLLKNNGEFIVITPNYNSLWVLIENILDKLTIVPKFAGKQHLSKFDNDSLTTILKNSGFSAISSISFNLFSFLSPILWLNRVFLKLEINLIGNLGCLVCVSAKR